MRCHVKIHGGKSMLKKIKGSTIYSAFSVGSRASKFGTDAEYLENLVTEINSLKDKPKYAVLFTAWELQQFNFDQFIVPLSSSEDDPTNKCSVLTEEELLNAFKKLESDSILDKISDEKKIDTDLAEELFAKMFEPFAKQAGVRLTDSLKPIWEKLETKITQNEIMQVDILSLGDIIKKYDIEKDWDNNGKNYNKYKQTFAMIEKEYANNELEKNEFDTTIQEVFEKRKFVEAGERLKYILRNNSAFSTHFENKALIRFIDAILNYLDFEKIGKKEIRMYLFTELAQMRCEPQNTYILYPHKPHKRLQKYYERHKIPLVLTNMYPVQLKEKVKQIEVPLNEQKHFSQVKSSEVAPNQLSEVSPVILFSKKSEQLKLSESKYSPVNNKQNDFIDHEDFKLESLEEKRQEPKIFSSLPLRQPRHNLSSLQIHSAFFSPVITPGTATKVGSVILDLSMVITILAQIQCGGAPQSLIFAEDKVEKALNQLKFLNAARSDSSQQDNVTYSPRTVVI